MAKLPTELSHHRLPAVGDAGAVSEIVTTELPIVLVLTIQPLEYTVPAYRFPPTPTPPVTINAPVEVEVAAVILLMNTVLVVVPVNAPRLPT